jgi:hypothetical protein
MKKFSIIFLLLLNTFSFSQSFPHITELRGLEDSLGNTHLFYRYISPYSGCWSRNIFHYDLQNSLDTLFIPDFGYEVIPEWGCEGDFVNDYEFFNNNPAKYIYCGYHLWIDPIALLRRYDGDIQIETFALSELEISKLNESLVYASADQGFFKSTDGGYNFEFNDSSALIDASIISISHNNDSQIYGIDDNKLVRTEDDGLNYIIVDNSYWVNNSELFYDGDGDHIYGRSVPYNFSSHTYSSKIYMSNDNGNPFTWNSIVDYEGKAWFTIDQYQSGENYYSAGKKIFKSIDYGQTYSLYKVLDRNVTGLYKKSGTNILYASTPLKIYEITPDTILAIKSLPIPEDAYSWLPMNLGDRWIYLNTFYGDLGDSSRWILDNKVIGFKTVENQVYNEILVKDIPIDTFGLSVTYSQFFRVDSSSGLIYQAWIYNDSLLLEKLYTDLLAEVGDTIPVGNGIYLESEEDITIFGLDSKKRTFYQTQTPVQDIQLVNGLGLIYEYIWELVGTKQVLKGSVIDGVVYGDTTTVGVEDEDLPIASEFKLEQNYPNPFNPSTKIKFTIPSVIASETKQSYLVTLKVYDVLGNEIATLVNEEKPAGEYEVEFNTSSIKHLPTSGVYFYQLRAGDFVETKKMILIK